MRRWNWKRLALAGLVALVFCASRVLAAEPPKPEPGKQLPQKLDRVVKVTLKYLLYLPEDYAQKDAWPLLLFLHGAGERGDDLDRVKVHGPPKLIAAGKQFPLVCVSPQCPANRWWQSEDLTALVDEILEKYKVDKDRVYVTGLSMGGFGTWSLAAATPERFAALVPICGGGDPIWARRISHIPVWVFHGAKDSVVPLERSERMVEALQKAGGQVKFTVFPDAGHDSWTAAYNNPELYEWLLQQKRAAGKPGRAKP